MRKSALALLLATALAGAASAQPPGADFTMTPIPTPEQPGAIPLWDGVAPGSEGATQVVEQWDRIQGERAARNVTRPTLTPFLPAPGKATGAAVIVAPGGAFMLLSMDNEGINVARWLADHGVAAFVLKYRLDPTPPDEAGTMAAIGARVAGAARSGADKAPPIFQPLALDDAQQALRLVRRNAASWGVDPRRVGLIGFSAGAMTALETTLRDAPDARPDFTGSIYGPMNTVKVPAQPRPLFVALAADDELFSHGDFGLIQAWKAAHGSVEFHLFQGGHHGFGVHRQGTTSDLWIEEFLAWMKAEGLLQAQPVAAAPAG